MTENSKNVPRYVRNIKKLGENPKFLGNNLFISPCCYYKNHQVEQEIDQTNFGLVLHELLFPLLEKPPVVVLFIQILVFVQPFAGLVKFATGGAETYIGTTPTAEVPQGF